MILIDKNQTLEPPEGYGLVAVAAEGVFLRVDYRRLVNRTATFKEYEDVVIYLTEMGRETARMVTQHREPVVAPVAVVQPVLRRFRFRNGFLIALTGIQEMFTCLKP